jgi:hypothetical protein
MPAGWGRFAPYSQESSLVYALSTHSNTPAASSPGTSLDSGYHFIYIIINITQIAKGKSKG